MMLVALNDIKFMDAGDGVAWCESGDGGQVIDQLPARCQDKHHPGER